MKPVGGPESRTTDSQSFLRKTWIDLVILVLGVLAIGAAFSLYSRPDWTPRQDVQHLNQGVVAFNAPPGILPAGEGRPSEYPIERAAWHWEQAAALSKDLHLKSLAYYNAGTLVGREAFAQSLSGPGNARVDMTEGIRKLGAALRADPTNADAKFNLELMEKAAHQTGVPEGAPGPGYSPGGVQKGY
jgi:hypothetical protein